MTVTPVPEREPAGREPEPVEPGTPKPLPRWFLQRPDWPSLHELLAPAVPPREQTPPHPPARRADPPGASR